MMFRAFRIRDLIYALAAAVFLASPRPASAQFQLEPDEVPPFSQRKPIEDPEPGSGVRFEGFLLVDASGGTYRDPIRTARLIRDLRATPFTHIVLKVRTFGEAYYDSDIVPKALGVSERFDPLAEIIRGLRAEPSNPAQVDPKKIYAWIDLYRVSNINRAVPLTDRHVLAQHPEWLGRNSQFEAADADGNQYLELGLEEVRLHLDAVVSEIADKYDLDGVVLDGNRYPGFKSDWGYHPVLLDQWRAKSGSSGTPVPDDNLWIKTRRDLVHRGIRRLYRGLKASNPNLEVMAMGLTANQSGITVENFYKGTVAKGALQDWPKWLSNNFVDRVIMQNYWSDSDGDRIFDKWNSFAVKLGEKDGSEIVTAISGADNIARDALQQIRRIHKAGLSGCALSHYREPVRDVASRDLFFRALSKTVLAPTSERLALAAPKPRAPEPEFAELPEPPPPPALTQEEQAVHEVKVAAVRRAKGVDEMIEDLNTERKVLIEPPTRAVNFLKAKFPNIFY